MFGIGLGEFILIIIVALLFISPEKLPEIAGAVVKTLRDVKRAGHEFKRSVADLESAPSPKGPAVKVEEGDASETPSASRPKEERPAPPSPPAPPPPPPGKDPGSPGNGENA